MLTTCPECQLQVSDKAVTCPHCGYPFKANPPKTRKKAKRQYRRLPNGFGRITKINRNLANPYRVMVTTGKDEKGRPIGTLLKPKAYFPTYNDAYAALVEYNRKPYDLDKEMTAKELYEQWYKHVENDLSPSSMRGYAMAWNYCSSMYDLRVRGIRTHHIRFCIERGSYEKNGIVKGTSPVVKMRIKQLWSQLLDYAVEYELIEHNPAKSVSMPKKLRQELESEPKHICFTDFEMSTLWEHRKEIPIIDVILFQCYSGWRPQELGLLELKNVDLDNWIIIGGLKTTAGKDRRVPIHSCIRPIVQNMYDHASKAGSGRLINVYKPSGARPMSYDVYRDKYTQAMSALGLGSDHRPHDPRKQFVTMANAAGMNEYAIKRIVGHSIQDVTEKIYTERDPNWLSTEIEKIKGPANIVY